MVIVEWWSRTVAIDILFLFKLCKNHTCDSAQYWLNNRRFFNNREAHRTVTSHLFCAIPIGAPKGSPSRSMRPEPKKSAKYEIIFPLIVFAHRIDCA
jgi:hypothetical protein